MHLVSLVLFLGTMSGLTLVDRPVAWAEEQTDASNPHRESRKTEIYISPYVLGTIPVDKNLSESGNGFPTQTYQGTNINSSIGAGVKAGAFPGFAAGILGLEGEIFGHGGKLKTPDGAFPSADAKLTVVNFMLNVLARYPGDILQPYIGAGIGVSYAKLGDLNLQSSTGTSTGEARDAFFAYQFLAGARAYVHKNVYLFGEYKYFGSTYNWESEVSGGGAGPDTSLNFRTHIVAGGVGISF
jgi:opacity protein-like surface antigen